MRRFAFALAGMLAASNVALAQEPGRTYVIGVLTPGHDEKLIGPREFTLPELARNGFVEGRNLRIEWRFAGGISERLPGLAKELVDGRVDLIIAISSVAIKAAKGATDTIPIVMAFAGEDPVADGIVPSLARPGGNATGLALLAAEGDLKRLELLREAMPRAKRLAYLASPVGKRVPTPALRFAAKAGFELDIMTAAGRSDYETVFERLARSRPSGMAIASFPTFFTDTRELVGRATAMNIATMCQWRAMAEQGCTFSYGPPIGPLFERAGWYAARILKGQSPADLPIEQPTKFELVVNSRAARALGLTIPPSILARADEVIE